MTYALHFKNSVFCRSVIGVLFTAAFLTVQLAPAAASDFQAGRQKTALVYNGKGACREGCAAAAARVFKQMGMKIVFVSEKTLTPELLKSAALYVQPGGNAIDVAQTYRLQQLDWIRNAIADGLGYVGFCAGSFLTDHTVDDDDTVLGLGILPGASHDFIKDSVARVLPVRWKGVDRSIYFQGGAYFTVNSPKDVEELARYSDGKLAALQFRFGKGKVSITGLHPEAPAGWLVVDNHVSLKDPDGRDYDLAVAMGRWAAR
jgi:glutamine amidotransferase-like uncharacterized protein